MTSFSVIKSFNANGLYRDGTLKNKGGSCVRYTGEITCISDTRFTANTLKAFEKHCKNLKLKLFYQSRNLEGYAGGVAIVLPEHCIHFEPLCADELIVLPMISMYRKTLLLSAYARSNVKVPLRVNFFHDMSNLIEKALADNDWDLKTTDIIIAGDLNLHLDVKGRDPSNVINSIDNILFDFKLLDLYRHLNFPLNDTTMDIHSIQL